MDEHAQQPETEPPAPEPKAPPQRTIQALDRDLTGLVASVDQHAAELDTLNALVLLHAFAFGVLAAIVFLQGRKITELTDALAG